MCLEGFRLRVSEVVEFKCLGSAYSYILTHFQELYTVLALESRMSDNGKISVLPPSLDLPSRYKPDTPNFPSLHSSRQQLNP